MRIILALIATALLVTPGLATDRCKDGTAPAGWKRPGGFCDISQDLHSALPYTRSTTTMGGVFVARIYDFDYGGWHYHDNTGGVWTVEQGSTQYTFVNTGNGSFNTTRTR